MAKASLAKLVTFEGIEGSGKTTQLELLARDLEERGVALVRAREPGDTPLGREIRRVLLTQGGLKLSPVSEMLLYLADRCQHLKDVIEPALAAGKLVLCDRYQDATLAYQGAGRGIDLATIERIAALLEIRPPDLTILLDLPVEAGLERARQRNTSARTLEGRFEEEEYSFHNRVRQCYLELARKYQSRFVVIDAAAPVVQVQRRVSEVILSFLGITQ